MTASNFVMWEIKLEDPKLGSFQDASFAGDLPDSKSKSGGLLCVFGSHTFVPNFVDVQDANRSFSQQCRVWNYFPWRSFHFWMIYQLFNLGKCVLQTLSSEPTKWNLERHKCERFIPSRSHSDNCVFESIDHVPPNIPYSSHSTQLFIFEDRCGSDPNDQQRTKSKPLARDENAKSRFGLIVWENEFGSFHHKKTWEQTISWPISWQKECFTTMQWHALLTLWQLRSLYEANDVRNFSRKPFSCSALALPQAMSQVMAHAECVDQMWDQYASKVLKSGCILDNRLSLEQWSNQKFTCTQDKREISLQECPSPWMWMETSCRLIPQILREKRVCETIGLFDSGLSKMHEAEVHVFLDAVFCVSEKQAMNKPEIKFNNGWNDFLEQYKGIRKENWWRTNSIQSPHVSWCHNGRESGQNRRMDLTRSRRRRVDRHGEASIWCRKCSSYARQRMRPKLMNCCKPEKVDTKECGKMLRRLAILKRRGSLPKMREDGKSKGTKEGLPGRSIKDCTRNLRLGVHVSLPKKKNVRI